MEKLRNVLKTGFATLGAGCLVMAALPQAAHAQSTPPAPLVKPAPAGAPNIVVILLDDVGFGATSTFGGPAATPVLDGLAADGISYTRFHTTGICSPTRAALLSGRNAHRAGMGAVLNSADARPGYAGVHGKDTAYVSQILKDRGYATGAFGKWHQTPDWETSQAGPFDRWPTGEGFEYFYGFQGGETDQYEPTLYEGTAPIARPPAKDYHFTADIADRASRWFREQKTMRPDRPVFLYFATGAVHAPIQVPEEWSAQYRGKFDAGWDALREQTFARQKAAGLFAPDAVMPPRPSEIPAWESLSAEERRFSARLMEAYAGFMAHTDAQIGKLVDTLKASGEYDNTLIFYVIGDNGASLEGGLHGSLNYMAGMMGLPQEQKKRLARTADAGTKHAYSHVNVGWAWANNAPFQWGKTMPAWLGAVRNPLVVTWPKRTDDAQEGTRRSQFGHVNDIAPTILDVLGMALPDQVAGIRQVPFDGISLAYTFDAPAAPERHQTQYFEIFGSRAIYDKGWLAAADHGRLPWAAPALFDKPVEQDQWRLFDLSADPAQTRDLAAAMPDKLAELQATFASAARDNNVLPLKGQILVGNGLPTLAAGRKAITYGPDTRGVPENGLPAITNRSWRIDAELDLGRKARGVIGAVGGASAGWSLWLDHKRRAVFTYRLFDVQTLEVRSARPLPPGVRKLSMQFAYDGKGFAKGGTARLAVDGATVGEGRIVATTPRLFTIDETFDVGIDRGSPVAAYPSAAPRGNAIEDARIGGVTISLVD